MTYWFLFFKISAKEKCGLQSGGYGNTVIECPHDFFAVHKAQRYIENCFNFRNSWNKDFCDPNVTVVNFIQVTEETYKEYKNKIQYIMHQVKLVELG